MGNRFVWIGLLFVSVVSPAEEDRKRVRVGGGYSVPWAYLAPDGTPTGFYVEVMKEAARREGLDFQAVFRKDGPEKALRSGDIDLWAAAVPTAARRKELYFTPPWWSQDHYIGVLAESPIYGINDLAGRTVMYATSPPFTMDLRDALPGAKLQPVNDLRSRFKAVCDESVDATLFYNETSLFAVTGSNEMAECRERGLRLIPLGRPVMEISIAALPENQALAERFRSRIGEMTRDQTLARFASSPLGGNESLTKMLQAARTEHRQRLLELSVVFLALVLLLGGVAHLRMRRANRRTRDALEVAEKALRVKSEFLATMSHEIRTPMTAVMGYMDMLMGTPLRHDQRRFATEVTQATAALLTLMTTILGYARPGSRTSTLDDETLDAGAVIDDCLSAVLLEAEAKGLSLTVQLDPNVPQRLRGDAVRLRQAVLNLLGNAVKFTLRGWVRLRVSYVAGTLVCIVSDSGEGIPEEKSKVIFEPFTQLDSSDKRRFGGVGLGLAIVADICRQLGGEVGVGRDPGGGACFTLRLPFGALEGEPSWLGPGVGGTAAVLAGPGEAVDIFAGYLAQAGMRVEMFSDFDELNAWTPPETGRVLCFVEGESFGTAVPGWRSGRTTVLMARMGYLRDVSESRKQDYDDVLPLPVASRSLREILQPPAVRNSQARVAVRRQILVVDDNAVNRRVLTALLEKLGCRVDTAKNGREAVDAALREPYAAILMDCQMPVMNGYEAAAEIRRHPRGGGDVPICGVSASMDAETRQRCEASGMTEFMPKPLTLEMLQDLLTRVTARQIIEENLQDGA